MKGGAIGWNGAQQVRSRSGAEIRSSVWATLSLKCLLSHTEIAGNISSELGGEVETGDRNMAANGQDIGRRGWKRRSRESSRAETGDSNISRKERRNQPRRESRNGQWGKEKEKAIRRV